MENKIVLAFAKNAAEYVKQTSETLDKAFNLIGKSAETREQLAAVNPQIIEKLAGLKRFNGSRFLPEGLEKQAEEYLSVHQTTANILSQVLDEYAVVKQAYDQITSQRPALGSPSSQEDYGGRNKQAAYDPADSDAHSQAFANFTRRVLETAI